MADIIHRLSGRRGEMVRVNCTAIADTLFASEVFGHVKGAYTGATRANPGYVGAAENGTLFLDEIGDLAPEHQPRLLRLLREGEYFQVGSHQLRRSGARVIAATNADVGDDAAAGYFRADLFQRLGGCRLSLRPLRERRGDVPVLLDHFAESNDHREGFAASTASLLEGYAWPGNVAELRACVDHATTLAPARAIEIVDLPDHIVDAAYPRRGTARAVFVLADFLSRARGNEGVLAAEEEALEEVLQDELANPPPVGGDEELDDLVRATVGATVAFAAFQGRCAFEQREVEARMDLVRRAGLLAEVQSVAQERGRTVLAKMAAQELREVLAAEDEVPWLGVAIKVLATVLSSDDPDERREVVSMISRLRESAPLLAGLVGKLASLNGASTPLVEADGKSLPEGQPLNDPASRKPWTHAARRPELELALEQASGNQAEAARSLGLSPRYFQDLVKKHGLKDRAAELRASSRGALR